MIPVTFYRSTRDPRAHGRTLSWDSLSGTLANFRDVSGEKAVRLERLGLWSPVRLNTPRRASVNVVEVGALVLDYDDGTSLREAMGAWDGYQRCGHTTWSHAPGNPRCRVILPLSRPVPGPMWHLLYRDVVEGNGQGADRQCIDPARAYYLPAQGAGGPHAAVRAPGALLDLLPRAEALWKADRSQKAAQAAQRARRLEAMREQARRSPDPRAAAERLLSQDPDARRRLADALGAAIGTGTGGVEVARRVLCPSCGRRAVWFALDRGRAFCNHRGSCGWSGRLHELG